ncbi:hypothetical protein Daus18300_002931 [Diaporthe australafricana]|uniref:Uncharacterized protein n=1 Tax=Diaporthe australafricana TaxID=127596 RepID=A0ABR3XJZ6_9PEZI
MAASSTNIFGLSDGEAKIAISALKLFVTEGKVEKGELATLTGHANPDSALLDLNTPTKGSKKTPSKKTPKKRSKKKADEDDDDAEVGEQLPKRVKTEAGDVTDVPNAEIEGEI